MGQLHRGLGDCGSMETLEVFRAQPTTFELLVTDNSMPKLTGLELAKEVTATRPEVPVLLIAGVPPPTDQLAQYGIRPAILKSCSMDSLEEALSRLLGPAEE